MITYQMVLFFFRFTYAFVHDEFDNPYSSADTGDPREKSHLCLSSSGWKRIPRKTKRLPRASPSSNPLRSSNDARPKMSDQLTVLPLTFN